MWVSSNARASSFGGNNNVPCGLVAVAIDKDKDKSSHQALRWAIENLVLRNQTIVLIHVLPKSAPQSANQSANEPIGGGVSVRRVLDKTTKELLLTYHCFCTRKDINCHDAVLEGPDETRAISEYVTRFAIENLVLGASRHGFIKFKMADIPTSISKAVPDFCTVYVISKSKISSVKNASRRAPFVSPILAQLQQPPPPPLYQEPANAPAVLALVETLPKPTLPSNRGPERGVHKTTVDDTGLVKGHPNTDISFSSTSRPSADGISTDRLSGILFDTVDSSRPSRLSVGSENSVASMASSTKGSDFSENHSSASLENEEVDAEMRRLKLELQRTMEMYNTAYKEAQTAKQKASELRRWRMEEERRLEEARLTEDSPILTTKQETRGRYKSPMQMQNAHRPSLTESDDDEKPVSLSSMRYRRYSIDEIEQATEYFSQSLKIGEGGYGPVFKCYLDHTRVAVKVLRPDAAQGKEQFHQEVEVLSCLRHPNMVLLLGACPEYGCLVYEYMANGSLEDCLLRRGNTRALSWQLRFRIAAEIATGLNFLHQAKPEPLVHRDLKPANILLDKNYVSKISDVGLARLVPASVAEDVTQYRMTSAAGTFCYIDPEYQQTGMLGVKSDVYSLGVMLLQVVTARPAMGLACHVSQALETGKFGEMLDPAVPDWPVEEATSFAELALKCAELRRRDRPALGKVVLPELNRLSDFGEENMGSLLVPN